MECTHTVDDKGNINRTWENDTARTIPFSELHRINVTPDSWTLNISESRNFNATGHDHNNDSIDPSNLTFAWYTSPSGVGTLNNSTGSVVNFTALHAGRTEIYAVNGSVSSNETYKVWITVNAPPEAGNVTNGTGNATSGNSTAIVNLNNRSINGTITIDEDETRCGRGGCTGGGRDDSRGCEGGCAGLYHGIRDRGDACSRLRDDAAQRVGGGTGDDERRERSLRCLSFRVCVCVCSVSCSV